MINVMVSSIAGRNILEREPCNKAHDSRIARLKYSVRLLVHFVKLVHEAIDNHLSWIKHRNNPLLGGFVCTQPQLIQSPRQLIAVRHKRRVDDSCDEYEPPHCAP